MLWLPGILVVSDKLKDTGSVETVLMRWGSVDHGGSADGGGIVCYAFAVKDANGQVVRNV